jgi:hypothetical protein
MRGREGVTYQNRARGTISLEPGLPTPPNFHLYGAASPETMISYKGKPVAPETRLCSAPNHGWSATSTGVDAATCLPFVLRNLDDRNARDPCVCVCL